MMLDRLPEDVTILVAEHLPVLDLLRVFRLVSSILAAMLCFICEDFGSPTPVVEMPLTVAQ